MAIGGVVAGDELIDIKGLKRPGLKREVHVRAKVVDSERPGPRRLAGGLAVEEEDVGLDAVAIKDTGGQARQGMHVALVQRLPAHRFPRAAFELAVVGHPDRGAAVDFEHRFDVLHEVELLVAGRPLVSWAFFSSRPSYAFPFTSASSIDHFSRWIRSAISRLSLAGSWILFCTLRKMMPSILSYLPSSSRMCR
jgi:hypothetical protein